MMVDADVDDQSVFIKSDVFERRDGRYDWTVHVPGTDRMAVGEGSDFADCHRQIHDWITEQFGVPDENLMVVRVTDDVVTEGDE